jgi:hypothetical protein
MVVKVLEGWQGKIKLSRRQAVGISEGEIANA